MTITTPLGASSVAFDPNRTISDLVHSFNKSPLLDHSLGSRPVLQFAFVFCLSVQSFFGTLGNLMVIAAVLCSSSLRHVGNAFIINLAIADLYITAVSQPANVLGALYGEEYFNRKPHWCILIAIFCATGCLASSWNLFMIALNRYFLICRWDAYGKVYTKRNTAVLVALTWIIVFAVHLPNYLGWGDLRFSKEFHVCTFANHVHSYALFFVLVGVFVPLLSTFACYLGIYLKVKDCKLVRRRILNGSSNTTGSATATFSKSMSSSQLQSIAPLLTHDEPVCSPLTRLFFEELKIVRSMFQVFLIFVVMWAPEILLILLHLENQVDNAWYVVSLIIAHGNSSINCLVYAATMEQFRDAFKQLFKCGWHRLFSATSQDVTRPLADQKAKPQTNPASNYYHSLSHELIKPAEN